MDTYTTVKCICAKSLQFYNSKVLVPQERIYAYIKFERDRLNNVFVRVFMSSGSMGG